MVDFLLQTQDLNQDGLLAPSELLSPPLPQSQVLLHNSYIHALYRQSCSFAFWHDFNKIDNNNNHHSKAIIIIIIIIIINYDAVVMIQDDTLHLKV